MASSTEQATGFAVDIPEGVQASLDGRTLTMSGKVGKVTKDFTRINVEMKIESRKIIVIPFSNKKRDAVVANSALSIVKNMIKGVTHSYAYKLKIVYAHFPISVKVKGNTVSVENFVGERAPRFAKIVGDTKVSVEGDDIIVKGASLEDVGQTAANLEQATKIKRKDQRIFLDGVYIYDKKTGE